ncbi:hypothetical protein RchiOBHm_Chr7g0189431 [Rosa chinensis]|uniref:TMEM205-like domain-containing protein n=1 Tax=Rosa chinensis TaxID=74649 RepID=A0A2P6P4Q3_ROSCH|nr:hypothetical protein RchiOBHm_Chr7g0189431 [Rosa chinensis]
MHCSAKSLKILGIGIFIDKFEVWLSRFLVAMGFLAIRVIFSQETKSDGPKSSALSTTLKLAHLLNFFTAFGAYLKVTFLGDTIMFKTLLRHQLCNLQSKMLPSYFTMVGICCAISVALFGYLYP